MLKSAWEEVGSSDERMLWAAAALCFFGFFRSGEMSVLKEVHYNEPTHLCFRDIAVDSKKDPGSLKVRLKTSKTDPFRKGIDVFMGRTGNRICPMMAYLRKRGSVPMAIVSP